jgi:multisubunit Na+/H+ antiporter MnhB subunit
MMGAMGGAFFMGAVILLSLLLFGLIVGTLCLKNAQTTSASQYVTSTTTYWVYAAIAFAIGVIMLLILLYLGYAWSCACGKKMDPCAKPKKPSCAPSSCY